MKTAVATGLRRSCTNRSSRLRANISCSLVGTPLATTSRPSVEIEVEPGFTFGRIDVSSWQSEVGVTERYCLYVIRNGPDTTVLIRHSSFIDT